MELERLAAHWQWERWGRQGWAEICWPPLAGRACAPLRRGPEEEEEEEQPEDELWELWEQRERRGGEQQQQQQRRRRQR